MNNVDITKTTTHLSLCSGYDGIGMGLRGIFPALREIVHVEIEACAIANLVAKMEKSLLPPAPVYTDLKTFPFSSFRGCVDILSGGFPCQPFSTAGKRKASEDPRHLFPYIKRGIEECRPRLVFLENVEGIISAKMPDGTSVLQYVLSELESVGYRATAGVFSAAEVGCSHQRKRVFILGVVNSERERPQGAEYVGWQESIDKQPADSSGETMADTESGTLWELEKRDEKEYSTPRSGGEFGGRKYCGGAKEADPKIRTTMADTERERREGEFNTARGEEGEPEQPHSNHVQPIARPGEQQFAYEEPRTKPKLGRAANGPSNRVDRLRACGNGVVPATAEKAFRVLINRLS